MTVLELAKEILGVDSAHVTLGDGYGPRTAHLTQVPRSPWTRLWDLL